MIFKLSCRKCGHNWFPRTANYPMQCPMCKKVIGKRLQDGTVVPNNSQVRKVKVKRE